MIVPAGVLSLQGSCDPHLERLTDLGASPRSVRQRRHLEGLTHLVLPGGESTSIHHLLVLFDLWEELSARHRAGQLALFGTCAGAILLGQEEGVRPPRLGLLDAVLTRNAYGTQIDSFSEELHLELPDCKSRPFHGVFIRAPRFCTVGAGAEVLATHAGEPVLVQGPALLAATFHPELTSDTTLHDYFLGQNPEAGRTASKGRQENQDRDGTGLVPGGTSRDLDDRRQSWQSFASPPS